MAPFITTATGQPAQNSPCHSFAIHHDFDGCEKCETLFAENGKYILIRFNLSLKLFNTDKHAHIAVNILKTV